MRRGGAAAGGPVVVLETSTGGMTFDYGRCMDELAEFCTVVAYDRSGLGLSSGDAVADLHGPRCTAQLGAELHQLLTSLPELAPMKDERGGLGAAGGVIVVGHGHGGTIAVDVARRLGPALSGLLLLDAVCGVRETHRQISPGTAQAIDGMEAGASTMALLSKFGLVRLLMSMPNAVKGLGEMYRPEDCAAAQAVSSMVSHRETMRDEVSCYAADDAALAELVRRALLAGQPVLEAATARRPPPTLVVSHGTASMFKGLAESGGERAEAQARLEKLEAAWHAGQGRLAAALSRDAVHVRANACDHFLPQHHPEVVVDAVRTLCEAAQEDGDLRALDRFREKWHSERCLGVATTSE